MTHDEMTPRSRRAAVLLAALVLLTAFGCGGRTTYPVEGKVLFPDGTPLAGAQVVMVPKDPSAPQVSPHGDVLADGSFRIITPTFGDGAFEGMHKVLVSPPLEPEVEDETPRPPAIDPKFVKFETSGLEHEVTRDRSKNYLSITVTKPPPAPPRRSK